MMRSSPCAKSASSCRAIGHEQAILNSAQAEVVALDFVDAEFVEGLAHVEIGLAGGDDADLGRAAARGDDLVELVGAHEGEHGVALEVVQARFLAEEGVGQADVEAAFGHAEIVRRDDLHAVEPAVDDAGRLDRLVHAFERGPGAGEARHGPAVERVVDDLLHAGRIEDRHHHVDEMEFGLMRGGGGFRGVVVAHQREHAAVSSRCRRDWRGGTRRRSGRRPGPCRTTCRTRHRTCLRRAARPAASPTARWRRGPR